METIKLTSQYAITNKDEFIQKVREASEIKQSEDLKAYDKQLKRDKKHCSELDGVPTKM